MRIEIICTGDEVLSGKTVNTNYSHMARRLQEVGLDVTWGTTVGDDRESLVEAFRLASGRADAVIVNGGLGPTVDDLSQEVAAQAAGVGLVLDEKWLANIEGFYASRGRVMPPNNRKQAMLPEGSEFIDNPVGTACGFAIDIQKARFFFTPGVPREIRVMLDDEIIPRLLTLSGTQAVVTLRRFHSFGLGESRVDQMLSDLEAMAPGGEVKLGFQAHFPQLETKLFARGTSMDALDELLAPIEAAVRERLGGYILAEGDETLERNVLEPLQANAHNVAVAECGTFGAVASRLVAADASGTVFKRGVLAPDLAALAQALGIVIDLEGRGIGLAAQCAEAVRTACATSHGLCVLASWGERDNEGDVYIAISVEGQAPVLRHACIVGRADRVRTGGVEMGLDCLRRALNGLPTGELIDFEKQPA
jgi:nicotinamide-nucleotide amidase